LPLVIVDRISKRTYSTAAELTWSDKQNGTINKKCHVSHKTRRIHGLTDLIPFGLDTRCPASCELFFDDGLVNLDSNFS